MLRKILVVLAGLFLTAQANADPLPKGLVGVWATDNSVLRGQVLLEGEALYLGPDGAGAIVRGAPTIGVKVLASFQPATGTISFDVFQHETVVGHGAAVYDARHDSVSFGDPAHPLFHRRFENVAPEILEALGL